MPTIETAARDEVKLLARLRDGDDDAFAQLVRAQAGRLLAVARRMLREEEEARDAVQEAFLSAFRSLASFEGQSLLSTWLHRITVNACLMRLRRRARKPEESLEGLLPSYRADGRAVTPFRPWDESALVRLEERETSELVRAAIDRLPEPYRTALLLRDLEDMDSAEIARFLGITPNALKIRVHRARQALRTLLDERLVAPAPRLRARTSPSAAVAASRGPSPSAFPSSP